MERERARARLGVPAAAAGVLYLLSGIILNASLSGLPTVGVLQGLAPALRGEPNPAVSPRAAEVRFVNSHAFGLIVGSLIQAVALVCPRDRAAVPARRRPLPPPADHAPLRGRWCSSAALAMAVVVFGHQIAQAIVAHSFAGGHDFSAPPPNTR